MIWVALICVFGCAAGFLLLWPQPSRGTGGHVVHDPISVIIPARNEELNLPALLGSIRLSAVQPAEVIVVDDASLDLTAVVARSHGATVLESAPLPGGWTGKTWACHQGAIAASADILLFLDADTFFPPEGYRRIADTYCAPCDATVAMSVLPYHVMQKPYEELSLFFNLLMAMGAGGFGPLGRPQLFGQSLIISRDLYNSCGGHQAVRGKILENLALSGNLKAGGGRSRCLMGRGLLNVRMYPDGLGKLWEGWMKAFADGAASTPALVLITAIFWLSSLCTIFAGLVTAQGTWQIAFAVLYLSCVLQLIFFARQVGNFSVLTCLFYPIPLLFYFALFGCSLYRKAFRRNVTWRGRTL